MITMFEPRLVSVWFWTENNDNSGWKSSCFSSIASEIFTAKRLKWAYFSLEDIAPILFELLSLTRCPGQPSFYKNFFVLSRTNTILRLQNTALGKAALPLPSLPLLHFEFNQPIGMGHHMSQAPNLISHFPALRPCCWSGLDSSG